MKIEVDMKLESKNSVANGVANKLVKMNPILNQKMFLIIYSSWEFKCWTKMIEFKGWSIWWNVYVWENELKLYSYLFIPMLDNLNQVQFFLHVQTVQYKQTKQTWNWNREKNWLKKRKIHLKFSSKINEWLLVKSFQFLKRNKYVNELSIFKNRSECFSSKNDSLTEQ